MTQMIEVKAGSVDDAVAKGLVELGKTRDQVSINVINEGSSGLFGIGSRDAVVQMTVIAVAEPIVEAEVLEVEEEVVEVEEVTETASEPTPVVSAEREFTPLSLEDLEQERDIAVKYLTEIIEKMGVDATVTGIVNEADSMTGRRVVEVSVDGDNLKPLIGNRGDTMESLQYLTRIMVGNDIRRRSNYLLDVGDFREKRTQALQRLAERMADKAVSRDKKVTLDPMSSYERRIIHMALRDDNRVNTESRGEGRDRRVVIVP